ncbi:MAG: efflux RND transporter periplasmic adaptor subunit [Lewinellaceae bacterium]|nr:efflux RND transporter periplasmic adaptor subunit [Saprospiraceae bacterium]MCB9340876.1 efflux RND transporter periplasmic adaptor subunit [Lewinellaceae bacterium]
MKSIIKIVLWTLALGGFGYWAVTQLSKNKAKMQAEAELTSQRNTTIPVVTATVAKATLEGKFNVVGNFAPYQQVSLMSETAGKITQLKFDNGSAVQAGTTVASIDNDLLKIQLETTKTNLAKAENDYNRLKKLLGEGGITQQQLDDAKLGIDNLNQQIKSIEKQISMTYVKAPISGIVSNKMVENGSLVSPSMKLADITNISRLKMQVYLTEEQVVTVKKGQKLTMKADLFPNRDFSGTVTFIDVNASNSRRYLVEIEINNPNGELKAGMTGTVYFEGGASREVLAIPRESIVGSLQDAKVYVVKDNKAILKHIETGAIFGEKVQVRSGLDEGETIVVSGQINLEDGKDIKIAEK